MPHREIKVTRIVEGFTLVFKWQGGEYIDICWPSGEAFEVINVWDAGRDKSRTPFTRSGLKSEIDKWSRNVDRNDLREYGYGR